MSKNIELDKFYTSTETARICVDLMLNAVTSRFFATIQIYISNVIKTL